MKEIYSNSFTAHDSLSTSRDHSPGLSARLKSGQLFRIVFMMLALALPTALLAQMPQGSISGNGPFCGSGAGMLTWTSTAGAGPFTVVYNDGVANRTVTNVVSGNPFNVFITPVTATTTYTLVSVTDAGANVRTSGFTGATATIMVSPKPVATATPATQVACSGSAISTITLAGGAAGTTYAWTRDNIAGITGSGGLSGFAGSGNINGTFTSTLTAPASVGLRIVPTLNGCAGDPVNVTVTVNPGPTVNPVTNQVVCPGNNTSPINFTGTASSFTWTNSNTSIGLAANGTGNIPAFSAINTTGSAKTATITVTPIYTNSGSCSGTPMTFTITVNPTVALSSSLTATTCSNTVFTYNPTTSASVDSVKFAWTRAVATGISNAAASGVGPIADSLINTTNTAKTVTYVYTVVGYKNGVGCANPTTYSVVTTVKPAPSVRVSPSGNQLICDASAITPVTISNPNNVAGTNFSWVRSNSTLIIGISTSGTGNVISGTLENKNTVLDTTIFTVNASSGGCSSSTTFNVAVNAPITSNKILASQVSEVSICGLPKQITIATNVPKGGNETYSYKWQVSSPTNTNFTTITGETDSSLVYFTNADAYFRRIVTSGGCVDTTEAKFIGAGGGNTSSITQACTGGSGIDITVTASYVGAIYTLERNRTGTWEAVPNKPSITGTGKSITFENSSTVATYRVKVEIPGNCTQYVNGTAEVTSTTLPGAPTATMASPATICAGDSTSIFATIAGGSVTWYTEPVGGITFTVDPIASNAPYKIAPTVTTTYYAKSIYPATGCKSSGRTSLTVTVNPTPQMTSMDSTGICSGSLVTIPLSDDLGTGTVFNWMAMDNPNTTGESLTKETTSSINNTIVNNTVDTQTVIYHVVPTIPATGCAGDTQMVKVTVIPAPSIMAQTLSVCSGSPFVIAPASTGGNVVPATTLYTWAAPSGSGFTGGASGSGDTLHATLTNTGVTATTATYTITPISGICSGAPFTATVTLKPSPAIINQGLSICNGTFSAPPFIGNNVIPAGTVYSWPAPTGTDLTGIASGTNQPVISGTLVNTSSPSIPVTATYTVTPSTADCAGNPFTLSVNLNFAPAENTAVWAGYFDNDWCNGANWACGILPDATKAVTVPAGTPHNPVINATCVAAVRDLDVQAGASLDLQSGGILNIYNAFINLDPAVYTLLGTVNFAGSHQDIPGFHYSGLGVTGGGDKTLLGPVVVDGLLTLDNGVIKTSATNMLTISATGSSTPGSNLSYVEGPLTRLTNSTGEYLFPVGGAGDVHPAKVTPSSDGASSYTVEYHSMPTGGNVPGPEPKGVLTNEYWDVTKNSGANAGVAFFYKNPNALPADAATSDWSNGMNPCSSCIVAVVYKDGANNWVYTQATPPSGLNGGEFSPWMSNGYVASRQMITGSSQFSFGYSDQTILPILLLGFNGHLQGNNALIDWRFASLTDVASTQLQHSLDGVHFETLSSTTNVSLDNNEYLHQNLAGGTHYYRLMMKDKNGATTYSRIVLLVAGQNMTVIRSIRPTVIKKEAFIDIHSASDQSVRYTIYDLAGRKLEEQNRNLVEGDNNIRLNTTLRLRGMYIVHVLTADGVSANLRIIKED